MERRMKTVENGKDHLICIESIFFPNVQAVAGSGKADERERERESGADGRATHGVSELSLCKTVSLHPSLLTLQHSPACSVQLCSCSIDEKVSDLTPASALSAFAESYLKSI